MILKKLQVKMPSPLRPHERLGREQWCEIESRWGLLPSDYRMFIDAYGSAALTALFGFSIRLQPINF